MLDTLKHELREAEHYLDQLLDTVEDHIEDFIGVNQQLWEDSKKTYQHVKNKLMDARQYLDSAEENADLQAHLAIMEARDYWHYQKKVLDEFVRCIRHQSQYSIDHARVQAHLAKMDSDDFFQASIHTLNDNLLYAKENVERLSIHAASSIKKHCQSASIDLLVCAK